MNRRAAALRRAQAGGYSAPADRPRQRRSSEGADGRSVARVRAVMHGVEVREQPDDTGTVGFRAYASIVEQPYDMWDMFGPYTETIAASAFDATLAAQPDVAFLLNHTGMTLARTRSGTLTIGADDTGLWYEPRLDPQNREVPGILSAIRRGDLDESSFAFRIERGSWDPGYTAYRIEQLTLDRGDVSIVNYGANPYTGDHPISLTLGEVLTDGVDDEVLDGIDDEQALALTAALDRRSQRRAARTAGRSSTPAAGMTRAELDAIAALAAPSPLAARVR